MKEWKLIKREAAALILIEEDGAVRFPTEDEAHQAVSYLNDQGSNIVTLYCRTDGCRAKGEWVQRSAEDAKKLPISCETCQKPMVR